MTDHEDLLKLSARELLDLGYSPAGVEVLKQLKNGELTEDELMARLDAQENKSYERKLFEFKVTLDQQKGLNRAKRRFMVKEFEKKHKGGA
jgi:transcription initiation factor IIE alpha subunit